MTDFEVPGAFEDAMKTLICNGKFWQELSWASRNVETHNDFLLVLCSMMQRFTFVSYESRRLMVHHMSFDIKEVFQQKKTIPERIEELQRVLHVKYNQEGKAMYYKQQHHRRIREPEEEESMAPPQPKRQRREESPPLNLYAISISTPKSHIGENEKQSSIMALRSPILRITAPNCSPEELGLLPEEWNS